MRCTIAPDVLIGSVALLNRPMAITSNPELMKNLNGNGQMKQILCAGDIDFAQPN